MQNRALEPILDNMKPDVDEASSVVSPTADSREAVSTSFGWQDRNGVDVTLIRAALRLTPDQRVRQGQFGAQQLHKMRRG